MTDRWIDWNSLHVFLHRAVFLSLPLSLSETPFSLLQTHLISNTYLISVSPPVPHPPSDLYGASHLTLFSLFQPSHRLSFPPLSLPPSPGLTEVASSLPTLLGPFLAAYNSSSDNPLVPTSPDLNSPSCSWVNYPPAPLAGMTQLFASSPSSVTNEKRGNFPGLSKKHPNESSHFPTKIKNFFRINSSGSNSSHSSSQHTPSVESKSTFRQSRFLPTIGRNRSTTVASEGNPLDEGVSPTATANPYFVHQGQPALQHRNDGSVPSSPPDTPELQVDGVSATEQATTANKEELARKLRRVASAPNAQGLFARGQSDERPQTADLGKEPLIEQSSAVESQVSLVSENDAPGLAVPKPGPDGKLPSPGQIRNSVAFRRTYSSNSIKIRNVEVGPSSFDKIKLIGKGDVGKVYLVREKKSSRLYAMKGTLQSDDRLSRIHANCRSPE